MKTKTILGWLAVLCTAYCVYISVNINPDLTIAKWFGYKFGLNITENMPFKLMTIATLFAYGYLATIRSDDSAGPK